MPRAVAIANVGQAFEVVKAMQADGLVFGDDCRPLARAALAQLLEERMAVAVERHLEALAELGEPDRRNGGYGRRLLTALGAIELCVPRTRRFSAGAVLRAYARREAEIDRMILACFVLGLSTRKVGEALLPVLGERISASTVSQVAKTLDAAVAGFHARPLKTRYRQLVLDGVVLARRTGAGAIHRPVLVALGIRPDGRKEVIDFCLAGSESAAEWERFLTGLYRRGLDGQGLEMICVDGGQGLLAALPTVYPSIAVQRCWAHKIRNVLNKVRKPDQPALKRDLHAVMNAPDLPRARAAARRFAARWSEPYPKAVACLRDDLDELLACFRYKTLAVRRAVRTTNAIERRFREVRRRTRPMGVFSDKTSMDRILFAVFTHENRNQGVSSPFPLTQTF
jgi:putative transposase